MESTAQDESRFLKACRMEPVDCTPIWFMRQAGRYLPEYRELRKVHAFLDLARNPELAAEVTLQPIRRFDLDAAIIFADILLPLEGMGVPFEFAKGEGPVIHRPLRTPDNVKSLKIMEPVDELAFVLDAIRLVRRELPPSIALIGFAGAPFTLASYMIEGGRSRAFQEAKLFMYSEPEAWHELMVKLATVTVAYLAAQIEAGAQAVQLFDSWVGCLGPEDYEHYVLPYSQSIFERLEHYEVPLIHFGTGTATLLGLMKKAGGSVIGLDWRVRLGEAWQNLGRDVAVQGNLDPIAMLGQQNLLREKVLNVLSEAASQRGHIFNLGHGILPQTPVENVSAVVNWVHQETQGTGGV